MKCAKCLSENTGDSKYCRQCAAPLHSTDDSAASTNETQDTVARRPFEGSLFAGRYEILAELGRGGMGEVYRVRDTKLAEEIALKLLRPEIASNAEIIERFRNELKLARKVTHKNVCRVYDFHEEGTTPFITMEYVTGKDLRSHLKERGRIPIDEAIRLAEQVTEGLVEAHALGVVHRDLKPQNTMIDVNGNVKIMDFGIARSIETPGMTHTGHMIGTPDYISPEQAGGESVDHRADIYSLGVMLYELVAGQRPFKGDTALSVALKHKSEKPIDPRSHDPEIPEDLSLVIMTCLEKDRERRYQNASDLLNDLRRIEEGLSPKRVEKRGIARTRPAWRLLTPLLVITAVIALAVGLWWLLVHSPASPEEPDRPSLAIMYFENLTGDEDLDYLRRAFSELLITDLAQSKFLSVLPSPRLFKILEDLGQLDTQSYSSDVLDRVASRGGVDHLLRGSYSRAGDLFRVNVTLQNMNTGELLQVAQVEGEGEQSLFSTVDDLTKRIKASLSLTRQQLSDDLDNEIGTITTSSPEAYALYNEGMRYHYQGNYPKCIELMNQAIVLDPEFASAYIWKAWSYDSMGYTSGFLSIAEKALELSARVSERERLLIQGGYNSRITDKQAEAFELYEEYLALYPDDLYGNHQLGYLYLRLEEYDLAYEYLVKNVHKNVEIFYPYYTTAWALMALGQYDQAREIMENYIRDVTDHSEIRFGLSFWEYSVGNYDSALEEIRRADDVGVGAPGWDHFMEGSIGQARGDLTRAEEDYTKMTELSDAFSLVLGHDSLGQLYLLKGQYKKAETQFVEALRSAEESGESPFISREHAALAYVHLRAGDSQRALGDCDRALQSVGPADDAHAAKRLALHLKGLAYLELEDLVKAQETVDALKTLVEGVGSQNAIREHHHLAGMVEMKRGNLPAAVNALEEAASFLPRQNQNDLLGHSLSLRRTLYDEALASAYYRAGELDKARETYEHLTALTIGKHHCGDLYAKAFYMLGQIHELQGNRTRAAESYETFLDLWKDADPGRPEVEDARERLADLAVK